MSKFQKKYGEWAIVTGASSGIGESFAEQLAKLGVNVVLVARSENKLQSIADKLAQEYGIQTRVLPLDLTASTDRDKLDSETADLDVGLLINNAAIEQSGSFLLHSAEDLRNANELNIIAPTELGQRFGQRFVKQGRGGIIFVGGSIGYQAIPHLANYAAAKAHQIHLAEALHYELRPYGVDVLALSPGITKTPMIARIEQSIHFHRIGLLKLTPDYVAKVGLKQLGQRASIVPGLQNKILAFLMRRALTRAQGAWLFGILVRFAFVNKKLLDPMQTDNESVFAPIRRDVRRQFTEVQ